MPQPAPARPSSPSAAPTVRLYDGDAESLISAELAPDRVSLLPGEGRSPHSAEIGAGERLRIMWGQDLLRDVVDGRYRAIVCGVNDTDNTRGIISQLVKLVPTSQWGEKAVTNYAKMFQESVSIHAAGDREPYVLKYDLDGVLILGLLRPRGRDHFTLDDLGRGFRTVAKMVAERRDRHPLASVSFLNAHANRLVGDDGREPSFEAVVRTMFTAGFRGDVYTAPAMWKYGHVGVFPTYPFPAGVSRMREGSS